MFKEASVEKLPKILLIEDNVDVLNYVTSCLQGRYSIEKALDGKVGVEKALQIVPDLIVSDVMMPELNGYEVCKRLKNDVRTSHIPIILLTAKADSDSRLAGIGEGADAYLVKPFDPKELQLRVRKLLELRKKLQYHYLHVAGVDTDTPNEKGEALIRENKFVENARDLVHTHLADPLFDVSFMCKELGMSRTQLHRKLTSLTGLSANQFIRAIRIKNAQDLLEKTSYSISEIAYQTGFSSPGYFTKVFKAETGKTPKQYRQYGP
jgi:YesN/AraC family two-component response regulator